MRYDFQPKRTEDAVARIAALFGRHADSTLNLQRLFQRLVAMTPAELARFAREARAAQVDLLCENYHVAPSPTCLVAITELLCLRQDTRWVVVAAFAFCQLPSPKLQVRLRATWSDQAQRLTPPPDFAWLTVWLEQVELVDPLDHVIAWLRAKRFPFEARDALFFRTPLFEQLSDWLFAEGGPLLTWLAWEAAATRANFYLKNDDQERLRHYLRHYPHDQVPADLLEGLYRKYGRLDPKSTPFFQPMEEHTLWGLRSVLFRKRMLESCSPKPQQAFWQSRLHRCQDWLYRDGVTTVILQPLAFIEKLEYTLVKLPGGGERRVDHDADFEQTMDGLVTRYLGW